MLKERVKQEEAESLNNEALSFKLLKDNDIAKNLYQYFDFMSKQQKEMMQTASDMREQSKVLMLAADGIYNMDIII